MSDLGDDENEQPEYLGDVLSDASSSYEDQDEEEEENEEGLRYGERDGDYESNYEESRKTKEETDFGDDRSKMSTGSRNDSAIMAEQSSYVDRDEYKAGQITVTSRTNSSNQQDKGTESPYTSTRAAEISGSQVEQLSPRSSRLASFSSGLKNRFGRTIDREDDSVNEDSNASEDSNYAKKEDEEPLPEQAPPQKPRLDKELSTGWMEFEEEAWDSSRHEAERKDGESTNVGSILDPVTELNTNLSSNPSKAMSTIGTGETPSYPASRGRGNGNGNGNGAASADVAFWEDDEDEEEEEEARSNQGGKAVDDDVIGKALETNSPKNTNPMRSKQKASISASPSNDNDASNRQQQQQASQGEKGWGNMFGNALGFVAQNLPFTKDTETSDDGVAQHNVVEVKDDVLEAGDDVEHIHDKPKSVEAITMQDYSALSLDSDVRQANFRQDPTFGRRAKDNTAPEKPMNLIESTTDFTSSENGGDHFDQMKELQKSQAAQEVENRIKFAREVDHSPTMPLFDLFVDMPHPAMNDPSRFPAVLINSPSEEGFDKEVEDDIRNSMVEIACLAFPEYDVSVSQASDVSTSGKRGAQRTSFEISGFQHHTFTLKLQSGSLVYAHVRRYLPTRDDALFRFDVGRRPQRALIIFSRFPGGDDFFASVLKTLDAISSQHRAMFQYRSSHPQKWFLDTLYRKHHLMCCHYATNFEDQRGAPHIITVQGIEFADCFEQFSTVDATHFFLPTNLLHKPLIPDMKTSFTCSILPLLRSLGVANSLRLLSALLCERRVVMVSLSPSRLDHCARAAMAMLAQGLLRWNHMCIPVLPPDMWRCLKSRSPYLIGVLTEFAYRLELTDKLGEVMVVNIDENQITAMGMNQAEMARKVPDLCRSMSEAMLRKRRIAMPESLATEQDMKELAILNSTSDFLAQDLCEILKADKQTMNGTAVAARHMARTATKAVKSTLKYFLGGKKVAAEDDEEEIDDAIEVKKSNKEKRKEPSAIFIEGCRNEAGEEAVRLTFVSFFLRLLGNSEGYLSEDEGSEGCFNKELFLKERKERGDGPGTPMWNMLLNFCETAMLKEYVKTREEHIRKLQPIPIDAPLFWRCIDYHVIKDIDFGILHVRSVCRKMLQRTSVQQMLPSNVRRLAMAITSKRKFEGNLADATADLAELSRESSGALYDVMSVIWLRLRDSKGLQWVHGYQAMRVLKEVIIHGPITAIADATDGLDLIRLLVHRQSKGHEQIQVEARDAYNLLVDRSRLFLRRRVAGEQRRIAYHDLDESEFHRDTRLNLKSAFKDMHSIMNPNATAPEAQKRRTSLSSRRTSLSSRLPHRLSISKHIRALEPMEDSMSRFPAVLPATEKHAGRHKDFMHETFHRPEGEATGDGSITGELAMARRIVREYSRKAAEEEKKRSREVVTRRDGNTMGVELLQKQFMLLKVALYLTPLFYFFGNHEHFLTIIMFLWLSQQFQVFRAPVDSGSY